VKSDVLTNSENLAAIQINSFEKPLLAFDALSKITKQFAYESDLDSLLEIMLLSLSGQFSIPNSFVTLWQQNSDGNRNLYSATGVFKNNENIVRISNSTELRALIEDRNEPIDVITLQQCDGSNRFIGTLIESGIVLIAPLWYKGNLIGLLGFGSKANRKQLNKSDISLFTALIYSIIPLIANSLLFAEISNLNLWYRNILDNIQQGIFVFDMQDNLIKINKAGLELVKCCKPEQLSVQSNRRLSLAEIFPDDIYCKWTARILEIKGKAERGVIENLIAGCEKNQRIFNAHISKAIGNTGGQDLIIVLEDMTATRENEVRFFELEKLAEKGLMASSLSHELNNYLALISGGVELTQVVVKKGDTEKACANLDKISGNLDKMTRFVKGLLNYGVLSPRMSKANINTIVSDVMLFVPIQNKFKNVRLEVDCYSEMPDIEMDVDQISQLLLNLINNSVDAINEAGRSIGHIKIMTKLRDGFIALSVTDNGAGITPENKAKLFETRFTTKKDGHGFGLATCAKILENHHGQIEVESEIGVGTTFIITFPVAENNSV
jgi:nitrogen-specific signal transduction histidine kinase